MVLLLAALAFSAAWAQEGMTLSVAAGEGSRSVLVSGTTSRPGDVTLVFVFPDGGIADAYQLTPGPGGAFAQEIRISPAWGQDGTYVVRAQQDGSSRYSAQAGVEIAGGRALETGAVQSTFDRLAESTEPEVGLEVLAQGEIGSDLVTVSGTAATIGSPVRIEVTGPGGVVVAAAALEPLRDGTFSAPLRTGGPLWEDGTYTVTARQAGDPAHEDSAEIEVAGGVVVPEFGAAAAIAAAALAGAVGAGRLGGHRII